MASFVKPCVTLACLLVAEPPIHAAQMACTVLSCPLLRLLRAPRYWQLAQLGKGQALGCRSPRNV
eukprot:1156973-Pelagomonas_calceolata.AAC.14